MIPYVEIPPLFMIGSFAVQPFGVLVLTGCIVGFFVAYWYAGKLGLYRNEFRHIAPWVLVSGFVFSHLIDMALYFPEELLSRPLSSVSIGTSMSSYGGFFGGGLAAIIYLRKKNLPVLQYVDALVMGLTAGWFFGRLGCSIAHDHPGRPSEFFLAVRFPDVPRHDLGLYEWLFTILLLIIALTIRPWKFRPGTLTGMLCVLYGPVRFMLDFLRVGDRLYFGFTPGQYFSVLLLGIGFWLLLNDTSVAITNKGRNNRVHKTPL